MYFRCECYLYQQYRILPLPVSWSLNLALLKLKIRVLREHTPPPRNAQFISEPYLSFPKPDSSVISK